MMKTVYVFLYILAASSRLVSSSPTCNREFKTFLHDLKSQCPFMPPFSPPPIEVDGESLERTVNSCQKNEYVAVLFHASWCPFSSVFWSKFSTLSAMYPQIKHLSVDESSAMPSLFSRYGIHSIPSLLIMNQKSRIRYYGQKDLHSLVNFYRKTTGLDAIAYIVEDMSSNVEGQTTFQLYKGASLKEKLLRESYLFLSVVFFLLRAFLYFFPNIKSHLKALCVAYIPRLNFGIFGESRQQLMGRVLHLIDVNRIWNKLKLFKTRNFQRGARNARVWASSLTSVS